MASIAMWNARALMFGTASSSIRKQKMCELAHICKSNSLVGVFESHGNPVALENEIRKHVKSHVVLPFLVRRKGLFFLTRVV